MTVLTFDEASHTYRVDGAVVPSVTQLLGKLHDFAGVPLDVLEAARQRGTAVHKACHFYDESDLDEGRLSAQTTGYLEGWKKFRRESACEIVECEQRGVHPVHRFAGTWDRALAIADLPWTVDIKTGPPHWVMGLQLAAYNELRHTQRIGRATVHLTADGNYKFKEWKDPTDWPAFLSLVTLHNIMEKHRGSV